MKKLIYVLLFSSTTLLGQTNILNEGFESGIPSGWTILNKDGLSADPSIPEYNDAAWIDILDPFDDTLQANHCAASTSYFTTSGSANRWLITPPLTLSGFGNILEFRAASFDPSFPDNYVIKIGTDVNHPENFVNLISIIAEPPYWTTHTFDLDTLGYNNQTIYVAFILNSNGGNRLFLDDINFRINDPMATKEIAQTFFEVYPNPTVNDLYIKSADGLSKEIYDLQGNKLIQTTENHFDVSGLNKGIYLLKVEGNNSITRFVKE